MKSILDRIPEEAWGDLMREAHEFGWVHSYFTAERKFGIRSLDHYHTRLKEVSQNDHIGEAPSFDLSVARSGKDPVDYFFQAVADYVERAKAKEATKDRRLELLERKIEYYENRSPTEIKSRLIKFADALNNE